MFMNYPAGLSYCNPLSRSDNYDMKLFASGYRIQHTIEDKIFMSQIWKKKISFQTVTIIRSDQERKTDKKELFWMELAVLAA